jgi:hypothetical protein
MEQNRAIAPNFRAGAAPQAFYNAKFSGGLQP